MVEIEEIVERAPGSARAPSQNRLRGRGHAEGPGLRADLAADLAAYLATLPVSAEAPAFAASLETLAVGLSPERISLSLPEQAGEGFVPVRSWMRPARSESDPAGRLDPAAIPGLLPALAEGRVHFARIGGSAARRSLFVPCMGPEGLLGVLEIEGAAAVEAATAPGAIALVKWIQGVAGGLAAFLERRRLTLGHQAALEAEHSRRDQDERLSTLGRVASSIAHDFNNVLTAILGYTELLTLELPDHAAGQEELAEIQAAAHRATGLVSQILSVGRRKAAGPVRVDLAALLEGLEGMLSRVVGAQVEVELDLPSDLAAVRIDPDRLERVLLNLAANARDAIAQSGRESGHFSLSLRPMTVSATDVATATTGVVPPTGRLEPGRYLRLVVSDDGCGIDPASRDRLFDPFYTTKAPGAGTGLGLATAAEVMREAGGSIQIDPAAAAADVREGATFHLDFPLDASSRHAIG